MSDAVERTRQLWTPQQEIEEYFADLSPGDVLNSHIRDFLHRVIQQEGPKTLSLNVRNEGNLRWEVVQHGSRMEVSIWIEN